MPLSVDSNTTSIRAVPVLLFCFTAIGYDFSDLYSIESYYFLVNIAQLNKTQMPLSQ